METLDPVEETPLDFIDSLVDKWGNIVVPFFSNNPKSETGANGFGSGFIIRYQEHHYLVTALHVVEDALKKDAVALNINGKAIVLELLPFISDTENDIAIAPIDEFLMRNGMTTVPAYDLDNENKTYDSLEYHLLIGYPGTKNKLDTKWNKVDRFLYSITAKLSNTPPKVNTDITLPLLYEFNPKDQIKSNLESSGKPPKLHGMSGGPAFEMCVTNITNEEVRLGVKLAGVLVEWHKNKQLIIATKKEALLKLLKS